jgi:hypothetical protein
MVKYLLLALFAVVLASCTSSKPTVTQFGDMATITHNNGTTRDAELIALQDNVLIVGVDSLWSIPQSDLKSVWVHIDQERGGWISMVAITQLVPSLLILTSGDREWQTVGLVGLAVTGGSVASFLLSEEQQTYIWPISSEEADKLRLRMRFPYGINAANLAKLQEAIRRR